MKIFELENDKEVVYVQLIDITMLIYIEGEIPQSILSILAKKHTIIDKGNQSAYMKFSNKEDVEYFKNLKWIYDYSKYIKLSRNKLDSKYKDIYKLLGKLQEIIEKDNNNVEVKKDCIKKQYELETLEQIYKIKRDLPKMKHLKPGENPDDFIIVRRKGKIKKYPKKKTED
ncbi:MAG TPA: hypothetical protein PKY25_00430 [Bacilli bacterium]|nr:hypothetical protein [Bacilli bacterium]